MTHKMTTRQMMLSQAIQVAMRGALRSSQPLMPKWPVVMEPRPRSTNQATESTISDRPRPTSHPSRARAPSPLCNGAMASEAG